MGVRSNVPTRADDLERLEGKILFSFSAAAVGGPRRTEEGDLNLDQNSLLESLVVDLDLWPSSGKVTEDEEDMMEDCLENCPPQVLAANSKAAVADLVDSLASVSTYITASIFLQKARAMLEETGWLPVLEREARPSLSLLRSAWQPTRRREKAC